MLNTITSRQEISFKFQNIYVIIWRIPVQFFMAVISEEIV